MNDLEKLQCSLVDTSLPIARVKNSVAPFRPVTDAEYLRAMLQHGEPVMSAKIKEYRERTTYIND